MQRKDSNELSVEGIGRVGAVLRVVLTGRGGVGYVKTQLSFILFIMLTTTCFGHCGPSSGHKNIYRGKLYRV